MAQFLVLIVFATVIDNSLTCRNDYADKLDDIVEGMLTHIIYIIPI